MSSATTHPVQVRRRKKAARRTLRHYGVVALFLSPWLIGFFALTIYPMIASLYYSFTKYDMLTPARWTGLTNYRFMFTSDPFFWQSLRNTAWIVLIGTPISIAFAIGTAMVLVRIKGGRGVYRTVFFVPTMVPVVAATLGFVFLLNPSGPVNTILRFLHLPEPLWFQDPTYAKPALVLLGLWVIGETMIIFMAAMLDVPAHLYEAADIEGASAWQKFRHITLPMISPVIFFTLVLGVIWGFQYFTQAYVAASSAGGTASDLGYPQGSTMFYGIWLYQQAFNAFHMGYASALAWVLFLIIMAFTVIMIRTSNRWVHYQGGGFR